MSSQTWWYMARAGGITAWALLAASVLWGLTLSTKTFRKQLRPNWMLDLHRFLGGLAVVFTAVHVLAISSDSYVSFSPANVLIPFTGMWHPAAVAWGIIGMYMLLAVELTSLARKRISKRIWRMTHFLSFPLFAATTVHSLAAGTDSGVTPWRVTVIATCLAITVFTALRVHHTTSVNPADRPRLTA
jgi:methionine sulfoxide reductase heme-binding subunit